MSDTLELTLDLIRRVSVTPEDAGCQDVLVTRLQAIGFRVERMRFGEVDNFWARHGADDPVLAFAGHTDVVPSGPVGQWDSDPFKPDIRAGYLYGRGTADMKGSLAAMVTACERFLGNHADIKGSIAFLITSDEEGPAVDGTVKVVEALAERGEHIDWCVIGEPTCLEKTGDVIKNGRRGSLNGRLMVHGIQGHVAYPHLAANPVHLATPALAELCSETWDAGNEFYPPTTFQISNLHAGTGADNVIPGDLDVQFNFRYSTEQTPESLQACVRAILDHHGLDYDLEFQLSGNPFLTPRGDLVNAAQAAVRDVAGFEPQLSTTGGTSDGRFIAPTGAQVVELGVLNATIHKVNECVKVDDLDLLSRYYERILEILLT